MNNGYRVLLRQGHSRTQKYNTHADNTVTQMSLRNTIMNSLMRLL